MDQARRCGRSALLVVAALMLGLLPTAVVVSAQEPLQFNVPYRCRDGTTYTVTRCEVRGRAGFCFWREEHNGQLVTEAYSVRARMGGRLKGCSVESGTQAGQPSNKQALNPPYLAGLPTVDRVKREIQGNSPTDSLARQVAVFTYLPHIIERMQNVPTRRYNSTTPDEQKIINTYNLAAYELSQAYLKSHTPEEGKAFSQLEGRYEMNPALGDEMFKLCSPAFVAEYAKIDASANARYQAHIDQERRDSENARAQAAAAQAQASGATTDPGALAARRCVEAGRSALGCVGEALGKSFNDLIGTVAPSLKKAPLPPGLRMAGVYPGQGFGLVFYDESAVVSCGPLVPAGHPYSVETKDNQLRVKIQSQPQPFALALRADGKLAGQGPIDVTGQVQVGTRYGTKTYSDGRTEPISEPIYETRTVRCTAGTLATTGPSPTLGTLPVLGSFFDAANEGAHTATMKPPPPGLRMNGEYAGQDGFNIEFQQDSAVVGCGQAAVAHTYLVEKKDTQVLVTIEDTAKPIALVFRPDGRLAGSGSVEVNGRAAVGTNPNGDIAYVPRTATCAVGILTPTETESAAVATPTATSGIPAATSGASAAATSNNKTLGELGVEMLRERGVPASALPNNSSLAANPTNAPASAASAGHDGNAVLSVVTAFTAQPGATNPLAGHGLMLAKESFANLVTKAGFQTPPGKSPIQGWAAACQAGGPTCQQPLLGMNANRVGFVTADPNGKATFSGVPPGIYYLVGSTRYHNGHLFWDVKVVLKPRANSVTLDQRNAVSLN